MTVFIRSDMTSVALSPDSGGCGVTHPAGEDHTVNCAVCEPVLVRDYGAAFKTRDVEKTPDEEADLEEAKEQAALQSKVFTDSLAAAAAKLIVPEQEEKPKTRARKPKTT